jgi:N-acyl-D-amino-acid deacylase
VQVFADQYPYEASSTGLREALVPAGGAVSEPVVRENLRRRGGPDAIVIASFKPDRSLEGKSLSQIAEARGVSPERAAAEMIERGSASIVSFNMSEQDIRHIMTRPYTMASSDGDLVAPGEGKPHPRNNGAFARRLAVYVRERHVVDLESAIRSMTSLAASVFGMKDRGVIREGGVADLAIFDSTRVKDTATYEDPHKMAEGMSYVLVNGVVVLNEGRFTDALPGRVLRNQRHAPETPK